MAALCVVAPGVAGAEATVCNETNLGTACTRDGKSGTCGKGQCCHFDHANRKPNEAPPEICAPCILCIVPQAPPVLEKVSPTFPDGGGSLPKSVGDATPTPPTPPESDTGPAPAPVDKNTPPTTPDASPSPAPPPAPDATPAPAPAPNAGPTPPTPTVDVRPAVPAADATPPKPAQSAGRSGAGKGAPTPRAADEEPVTGDDVLWIFALLAVLGALWFLVRLNKAEAPPRSSDDDGDGGHP